MIAAILLAIRLGVFPWAPGMFFALFCLWNQLP